MVDRVAAKTSTPAGEQRLAARTRTDQLPAGRSARRRRHGARAGRPRCRRRADPQAVAPGRPWIMKTAGRVALAVVGLVIGIVAVLALREATLSTHQPVPHDSRIELVVTAHSKGGAASQTLAEMVEAQLLTCRLEVSVRSRRRGRARRRRSISSGVHALDGRVEPPAVPRLHRGLGHRSCSPRRRPHGGRDLSRRRGRSVAFR